MSIDLFASTTRPVGDLLYRRGDRNDPRLGEVVRTVPEDYARGEVVLLGCPNDEGVRRNKGRIGAAAAPEEIRACLYRMVPPESIYSGLSLFDLGNTIVQPTLEATHELHQALVEQILRDGKRLITLGGGNDLSYPDCAAVGSVDSQLLAFNIDAHFDVRADEPRNSGTPYRQLLEAGYLQPPNFFEIGGQPFANSPIYRRYLEEKGVGIVWLDDLRQAGITATIRRRLSASNASSIFWGFDLDSVRAADAPGVSAPNPTGLYGEELCEIAGLAGQDQRTRLIEFTEVNPAFDLDRRTCRLAAAAIFHFLDKLVFEGKPA